MSKKHFCIHLLRMLMGLIPFGLMAQQPDPFHTVESFFEAFHKKDSLELQKYFAKEAQLSFTANSKSGQPTRRTLAVKDFVQRVCRRPEMPVWEERLGKPDIEVHQNLASIWVPFQFYLDGKFSHQGHNFFLLFWNSVHWEILYLSDTRE